MDIPPLGIAKDKNKNSKKSYNILPLILSAIAITPSTLIGILLNDHNIPVHYSHMVAVTVISLALFNFATVVMLEEYGTVTRKLTLCALITASSIIFMFVIAESFHLAITEMSYDYITPFLFAANLFIYFAILKEEDFSLKIYLSLNSIVLYILWAMGSAKILITNF